MLLGKILTSDNQALWGHPDVDGVRVGLQWGQVEATPGAFDWGRLDQALDAVPSGKQIYLDVVGGAFAPQWLQPSLTVPGCPCPVPATWTKPFLRAQERFWGGLGLHLEGNEKQITAVNASLVGSFGSKLRFGPSDAPGYLDALRALDYRPSAMLEAWQECSKALAYALPVSDLIVPVMDTELESFPALSEEGIGPLSLPVPLVHQIVGYGASYYPGRFVVAWSGRMEDSPPEAMRRYELQGAAMAFAPKQGLAAPEQCQAVFLNAKGWLT